VGVAKEEVLKVAGERGTARATDGYALALTRFTSGEPVAGTVLLAGAMGVPQDFYFPFAGYLAEHGFHALTFDYRGMGESRPATLRGFEADVTRWAERDLEAMLHEAQRAAPAAPLFVLGHSLGGQILGITPGNAGVHAAITVTAGSGYYRYNDRIPGRVRFLWFVAMPLLTRLFGYFPGRRLRMVGDLPRGVARQWRSWCLHPEYLLAEGEASRAAFARVTTPILGYSFEDDDLITRPAIDHLHSFYRNATVERRHLRPEDAGESRIGHFGYFSGRSRDTLWKDTLAWMRARL